MITVSVFVMPIFVEQRKRQSEERTKTEKDQKQEHDTNGTIKINSPSQRGAPIKLDSQHVKASYGVPDNVTLRHALSIRGAPINLDDI